MLFENSVYGSQPPPAARKKLASCYSTTLTLNFSATSAFSAVKDFLPAASLHHVRLGHGSYSESLHRAHQVFADFKQYFRIVKVRGSAINGASALFGFRRFAEVGAIGH